eukprot:s1633_g26.t1
MDDMDAFEASEPSQPSSKRRKLLYQELETFECQANSVREVARIWALSKNEKVGSFRSPRLIPTMQWETTANCHKHTGCFAACGRVFRFRGARLDDKYVLEVAFAQDHSGEVRATLAASLLVAESFALEEQGWTTSTSWRSHLRRIIPVRCVQSDIMAEIKFARFLAEVLVYCLLNEEI